MTQIDPCKLPEPTLDGFTAEAEAFLAAHYPPRPEAERFVWGEGPDGFPGFAEPTPDEERAELAAVKEHRARLFDAGLAWITGPPAYGGRGLPVAYQKVYDALARRYQAPTSGLLTVGLGMVAPTILAHGSDATRQKYLVAMQRAELIGCQLFSEPGAGSDLAGIATRAEPDGDEWVVRGQKVWTSGAHLADVGLLLARTAPGPRHRNLTMFLVDMHAPGVTVRPLVQMTGAAFFNEVFLDEVRIPDTERLGEVGEGWRVALTTLANERGAIGGAGLGGAGVLSTERLMAMIRHCGRAGDPVVRQKFARLYCHLKVAVYSRMRSEAGRAAGQPPGPEMSGAKLALSRNMCALEELVGHLLGPKLTADSGEWGTWCWSDVVLTNPGLRIGGGTDEVMKNIIAERVLGLPKEPAPG